MFFQLFVVAMFFAGIQGEKCPQGGQIYAKGINAQGKIDVIKAHNKYRLDIANGRVKNQPRGVNLLRMVFDERLSSKGRPVSIQCKKNHIIAKDSRWSWVGQNLYIEWSSTNTPEQNWYKAVKSWFDENVDYKYPTGSKNGNVVGHYTQLVWANSKYVGCDFIRYYDFSKPQYPYAKLYTCNYGPGGNFNNGAPYKTGGTGCSNLC